MIYRLVNKLTGTPAGESRQPLSNDSPSYRIDDFNVNQVPEPQGRSILCSNNIPRHGLYVVVNWSRGPGFFVRLLANYKYRARPPVVGR